MRALLHRLFNVYPDEERNALLFALLAYLWAFAATLGLRFGNALFLLHVGAEELPFIYGVVSTSMIVLAFAMLYGYHRFEAYGVFLTIMACAILFYLLTLSCIFLRIGIDTFVLWYVIRVFGALFFQLGITGIWTFIDQFHTIQDGKRLFCLFSSMIFLGDATTGMLMRSGILSLPTFILLIVGITLLAITCAIGITRLVPSAHEDLEKEPSPPMNFQMLKGLWSVIIQSRFTKFLMLSNFLIVVLWVITEFNYLSAFDAQFDPEAITATGTEQSAPLTLFLGQLTASVSLINIFIGLFLYSRLIRRFGLGGMLVITPCLFAFTFFGWQITDSLMISILGYFVVEGTMYVIDDNNFTLLLNGVPSKIKYKVRVLIETFFEPVGMLCSAAILGLFSASSRWIGLVLSLFLLAFTLLLGRAYYASIYRNLIQSALYFGRTIQQWFSSFSKKERRKSEKALLSHLSNPSDPLKLLAIEGLLALKQERHLQKILASAETLAEGSVAPFLLLIEKSHYASHHQYLEKLRSWSEQRSPTSQIGKIRFTLAKHGMLDPTIHSGELDSSDLLLRGATILAFRTASCSPNIAQRHESLFQLHLSSLLESDLTDAICLALDIIEACGASQKSLLTTLPYLEHPEITVVRKASAALASIATSAIFSHAHLILPHLTTGNDAEIQRNCLLALSHGVGPDFAQPIIEASIHFRPPEKRLAEEIISKMGKETTPTLLSIMNDQTQHDRCRSLSGRILNTLAPTVLREHLHPLILQEINRAAFYLFHYETVQQQHPDLDLTILKDALLSGYHSVLDFIIQLLGSAGEVDNCDLIFRLLRSKSKRVRSQVVEMLEKTCTPPLYLALRPLVEETPRPERIRHLKKMGMVPLSLNALLDKMGESPLHSDQIASAALMYGLNLPNWRACLIRLMTGREEIFHHFAKELLET